MTDDQDTVMISLAYLKQLEQAERELDFLCQFGVDNWEGYGEAMAAMYEEEDEDQ